MLMKESGGLVVAPRRQEIICFCFLGEVYKMKKKYKMIFYYYFACGDNL